MATSWSYALHPTPVRPVHMDASITLARRKLAKIDTHLIEHALHRIHLTRDHRDMGEMVACRRIMLAGELEGPRHIRRRAFLSEGMRIDSAPAAGLDDDADGDADRDRSRHRILALEVGRPRSEERRVGKECRSRWAP